MSEPIIIDILNNKGFLGEECWCCGGDGIKPECEDCDYCYKTGYQLTDKGRAVLELLERHKNAKI